MLITSTILVLVITQFVINSAMEAGIGRQQYFLVKSYNYNHPLSFEENNLSPNDDDIKSRKVRQIEQADEKSEHSQITESLSSTNPPRILTLSPKIPVPVSYDSKTNLSTSDSKSSNITSNNKRKRRKRPNSSKNKNLMVRLQNNEESSDIKEITSTTEVLSTTSPSSITIVPKVFTKRPAEDNPVVKSIRQRDPVIKIIENSNYVYAHTGNFHYSFEGADGTKVSSEGELRSFNEDKTGEAVVGSVFYKDNDGNDFSLSYTADENGYRPRGAHLPTPPPIPPAIARALAYLATKTTPEPVTEPIT